MRLTWSRKWPELFESHPVPWQTRTANVNTGGRFFRQIIDAEFNVVIAFPVTAHLLFYRLWAMYLYCVPPLSVGSLRSRLQENVVRSWPQVLYSHPLPWRLNSWPCEAVSSWPHTVTDSAQGVIAHGGEDMLPALQLLMELSVLAGDMHHRHDAGLTIFRLTRGTHEINNTQEAVAGVF